MRSLGAALIIITLSIFTRAHAELRQFCSVEKVDVQKVVNAVIIKLQCDGLVDLVPVVESMKNDFGDEYDFALRSTDHISFTLDNVISGSASMVNIAQYPVSHLSFEMEPGTRQNIGLRCILSLYKPGYVMTFIKRKREYSRWMDYPDRGEEWDWTPYREYFGDMFHDTPEVAIQLSDDQRQVIITVQTGRPEEPEPVRPPIEEAPALLQVGGTSSALNIYARHADLKALVQRLADQAETPVFVDDRVRQRVTAHLTDISLSRALQIIANGYGLNISEEDGAYYLTLSQADNPASYWAAASRTVTLKYLAPSRALLLLPEVVLPYVHPGSDANALVLHGPEPILERIEHDLRNMDQPGRHCRLRCWIVSNDNRDESVREVLANISGGNTFSSINSEGDLSITVDSEQGTRTIARLRALEHQGKLHIEAVPSIICLPGGSANLFVGQGVYYLRVYGQYGEITLDKINIGTTLDIWARNVGDDVTAWIKILNSFAGARTQTGPTVFTQRAQSVVRMKSGDVMIIGGLRSEQGGRDREQPLPALGPLSDVIAGCFRQEIRGDITLLVQAQSLTMPLTAKSNEVGP